MKVKYQDKTYDIIQKSNKMFIKVGKKEIFAGYGEGNMNYGFKLVHNDAPKDNE